MAPNSRERESGGPSRRLRPVSRPGTPESHQRRCHKGDGCCECSTDQAVPTRGAQRCVRQEQQHKWPRLPGDRDEASFVLSDCDAPLAILGRRWEHEKTDRSHESQDRHCRKYPIVSHDSDAIRSDLGSQRNRHPRRVTGASGPLSWRRPRIRSRNEGVWLRTVRRPPAAAKSSSGITG